MFGPLIAAAGFADISAEDELEFVLMLYWLELLPVILCWAVVLGLSFVIVRDDYVRRKFSLRSCLVFSGLSCVALRMLKDVCWR